MKQIRTDKFRSACIHKLPAADQRDQFKRDRDRILYSTAFRRLAGITEIVRAGESDVFHTRQLHTLKVAQIGRRLAELCIEKQPTEAKFHNINPDVVEAACLAHDLGHPPFGHAGEEELNKLLTESGEVDGFEGNAQTFRVVTKLSHRFDWCDGLNLSRATLAATIKYPWFRNISMPQKTKKWGSYKTEKDSFDFARKDIAHESKLAEAELMDWADDITYSVHDLEDFHRCNAIPWYQIFNSPQAKTKLIEDTIKSWWAKPNDANVSIERAYDSFKNFMSAFNELIFSKYDGTKKQRTQMRTLNSQLISKYINSISLIPAASYNNSTGLAVSILSDDLAEIQLLKQITKEYIISSPSLAAQQKGQKKIIKDLFNTMREDTNDGKPPNYIPTRLRELWHTNDHTSIQRTVADCISCLTESEVINLHSRIFGQRSGSVLDPLIR